MRLLKTVAGLRAYLQNQRPNHTIGLVPTMGALHLGHVSLIKRAVAENNLVLVSIFVNPLQFSPTEDLQQYPRPLEQDCQLCQQLEVDVVFAPNIEDLGIATGENSHLVQNTAVVPPISLTSVLCGVSRPGHFQGVATIVTKLLNIVQPNTAYFGEKDAQQLAIIQRLVKDLNLPVIIKPCPLIREASGLAYSSRNQYLSAREREEALTLYRSLNQAKFAFKQGERNTSTLINLVKQELAQAPTIKVQYTELVHPQTLTPLEIIEESGLLAIAAYVGSTRLIDNLILRHRQPIIAIDGPAGAGKSTVTRRVAQALGLLYLDTGAMYRAITWLVMQSGIELEDETAICLQQRYAIAELVQGVILELISATYPQPMGITINGEDVTEAIRTPEVTANVSKIAALASVREVLVKQQQLYGKKGGIVAEGRDIGSHVFPDAEVKIFLTASVQERARRRLEDFKIQGQEGINLEELQQDIQRRDDIDSQRKITPLRKADDAVEIITDNLSIQEVTDQIISLYREVI